MKARLKVVLHSPWTWKSQDKCLCCLDLAGRAVAGNHAQRWPCRAVWCSGSNVVHRHSGGRNYTRGAAPWCNTIMSSAPAPRSSVNSQYRLEVPSDFQHQQAVPAGVQSHCWHTHVSMHRCALAQTYCARFDAAPNAPNAPNALSASRGSTSTVCSCTAGATCPRHHAHSPQGWSGCSLASWPSRHDHDHESIYAWTGCLVTAVAPDKNHPLHRIDT